MTLLMLFNYLFGSVVVYCLGYQLSYKGVSILSLFIMLLGVHYSLISFLDAISEDDLTSISIITLGSWVDLIYVDVLWELLIDSLTIIMSLIITVIAFIVQLYSVYYMGLDKNYIRFNSLIMLFTFFMLILVASSNFVVLFFGWEGVGICSFLLISFWSTRIQANKAAIKAMLVNRVGDYFLLMAIVLIVIVFRSVDFYEVFALSHIYSLKICFTSSFINLSVLDVICLCLLVAAATKSAQIGMHGWLPDAMEGPTPVSALIHAATMVTAGIFLIIRCSYMFEFSPISLTVATYLGSITLWIFGLVALAQFDIKKIIAYSTCSQLGYMMLACGLSGYNLALFHLFTHAWFKALLFLAAGSIIHSMKGEQDIRKLSGTFNKMPLVSACFIIGNLSLIGFPHMSGYYSKDAIISLSNTYYENPVIFISVLFGTMLTIFYTARMCWYLFFKTDMRAQSLQKDLLLNNNEKNELFLFANYFSLICLTVLSVIAGYYCKIIFTGIGNDIFFGVILLLDDFRVVAGEFIFDSVRWKTMNLLLVISFIGVVVAYYWIKYLNSKNYYLASSKWFVFFHNALFWDSIVNCFIVMPIYRAGFTISVALDKTLFESIGPKGVTIFFEKIYLFISKFYNDKNHVVLETFVLSLLIMMGAFAFFFFIG